MDVKIRDMFNNIGKPQYACLDTIYDLNKRDIRELMAYDGELCERYVNWKHHNDRKLLLYIIQEWKEVFRLC